MAPLPHEPPGEPLAATRLRESQGEWGQAGSDPGCGGVGAGPRYGACPT